MDTFYRQDLRNTLGLAIKTALKSGVRPDIKEVFTKYETIMEGLNTSFNDANGLTANDLNPAHVAMGKALTLLINLHL